MFMMKVLVMKLILLLSLDNMSEAEIVDDWSSDEQFDVRVNITK